MKIIIIILKIFEIYQMYSLQSGYPNIMFYIDTGECLMVLGYSIIINAIIFYYLKKKASLKNNILYFSIILTLSTVILGYLAIKSMIYAYPLNLKLSGLIGLSLSIMLTMFSYYRYKCPIFKQI